MNPSAPAPICRICGASDFRVIHEVPYLGRPGLCRFGLCQACGTVADMAIFDPAQDSGSFVEYTWGDVRFYVEYGAYIDAYAAYLNSLEWYAAHLPPAYQPPRLLDVGTAFGFCPALAQARGWQAVGVEPSEFARYGRQYLGIEIFQGYLEDAPLPAESFDFVLACDVIEHVPDPRRFVAQMAHHLTPSGVLLIITPNSQVLLDPREVDIVDVLSPGAHLNLLSPESLEQVLRANGFCEIHTTLDGGLSGRKVMLTLACRQPSDLPQAAEIPWSQFRQDAAPQVRAYLDGLADHKEQAGELDVLYSGALYNLLARRVEAGDRAATAGYMDRIDRYLSASGCEVSHLTTLEADDFYQYLDQVPAYTGAYMATKGRLALQDGQQTAALPYLSAALHLLEIEKATRIYPRAGWVERTRFERGCAALAAGQPRLALADFDALLADPATIPAGLHKALYQRKGLAHLRLAQPRQALRWLTRSAQQPPIHPALRPILNRVVGMWVKARRAPNT